MSSRRSALASALARRSSGVGSWLNAAAMVAGSSVGVGTFNLRGAAARNSAFAPIGTIRPHYKPRPCRPTA